MRRALVLLGTLIVAGLVGPASLALAQDLQGGCTVTADSGVDTTTVRDATQDDPFEVDPEGTLSWQASSPSAIRSHTWDIWVEVAGFTVTAASGGDPNEDGDQTNEGSVEVDTELAELSASTGLPLDQMRGLFHVGGQISGEGGSCQGNGYVLVRGGLLEGLLGKVGLGLSIVGGGLFFWAGFRER